MRALVIFESMYGNTRVVAERIGEGLALEGAVVDLASVHDVSPEQVAGADLLVVGGPTHVHGLSSGRTREAAKDAANKPGSTLRLEPDTEGPCLRDWFSNAGALSGKQGAAFDTRLHGPTIFTGRASKGIAKRLKDHGCVLVRRPESFLVDKHNQLFDGEADRAVTWGRSLAGALVSGS